MKAERLWPVVATLSILLLLMVWANYHSAPPDRLNWICLDLDGEHAALPIEPGGEGTLKSTRPTYEIRLHLCSEASGREWSHDRP